MAEAAPGSGYQRLVLLNRIVSRSRTRAPQEHKAPIHGAAELLEQLDVRRKAGHAIEFLGLRDKGDMTEKARLAAGVGHDFVSLRDYKIENQGGRNYVKLLFEYIDQSRRSFPVVHTSTLKGRELSGEEAERGATAAHVVVRLPAAGEYDDGSYRCTVEVAHSLNRSDIERFVCRQLRRANAQQTFGVTMARKDKKPVSKEYAYWPRLELFADVSRKINFATEGGKYLSHMVFTKRSEKKSIGKATALSHEDVIADVEYKVPAKQGPDDPKLLVQWANSVRKYFETEGFESRLYYRGLGGATLSGDVHKAVAGASDLLMCPREVISLEKEPKAWQPSLNREITGQMIELLQKDGLWERSP